MLVLGGAKSVWRDASAATDLADPDLIVAVNDIGSVWPDRLDIWATLHPEKMADWREQRRSNGHTGAREHVAHERWSGVDRLTPYQWPGMNASGSSGLYAVKVALEAGASRVVLAGIPMSAGAHFNREGPWNDLGSFTEAWKIALPRLRDAVRSMSGWTRELLGAPTPEWLAGDPQP